VFRLENRLHVEGADAVINGTKAGPDASPEVVNDGAGTQWEDPLALADGPPSLRVRLGLDRTARIGTSWTGETVWLASTPGSIHARI